MSHESFADELQAVIRASRKIAINFGHQYIHTDHFFLAMLQRNCIAAPFLSTIDKEKWARITKENHPADDKPSPSDSLPLTLDAERVVLHADTFAFSRNEELTNSLDVLLAMLAYDNPIKDELRKAGWLFEHILEQHYGTEYTWPPLPLKEPEPISKFWWKLTSDKSKKEKIERLYRHALTLADYGMYKEMKDRCNIALTVSPGHPDFTRLLAYAAYQQRNYNIALPLLKKLEQHPSEKEWCTQVRMDIEGRKGNHDWVISQLEQLLEEQPGNALTLNNIGYTLTKQQHFAAAVPRLEKAIAIDPDLAYAHNNLGSALYRLGKQEDGIAAIQHSLTLDKGNSYAYKNLGIIYLETGNIIKAKEYFQLALKYKYTELYDNEVLELLQKLGQ